MMRRNYEHGALLMADGRVHFRLWAPGTRAVTLHVQDRAVPMTPAPDGWFEAWETCPAGTQYSYEPQGLGRRVPDPASRLQAEDVDGPSVVVDPAAWQWKHAEWRGRPWCEAVLYEAHPGLMGGFAGLRRRLPELADLGVTALELMPIADFPGPRNWGYDGVLPYAPDRAYGSPEALRALVDEAHGHGMMVFLDVVYNHFGPVGNFLPTYAPQFFRTDVATPWGDAIDFRQAAVRSFFADNALYWLKEFRFDGLRFDAVHAIVDKEDWLQELAGQLRERMPADRLFHLVLENDDNTASLLRHGFDAQWNDDAHHVVHHLLTGEAQGYYAAYARQPTEKLARALAQGFVYQGESSPAHGGKPRGEPSYMLNPTAFVFFLQNHDQVGNRAHGERLTQLCKDRPDALAAVVALQLLSPSIPLIFMGEEGGLQTPFLYFTSFEDSEFAARVREGRRAEFADFHRETGLEIPDPNAEETWNRCRLPPLDSACAQRWVALYRTLLELRRRYIVPGLRGAVCESAEVLGHGCVAARWELDHGLRLLLVCNLSDQAVATGEILGREETVFHESREGVGDALREGTVPAWSTVAALVQLDAEGAS
ncbi:MAG TPA: malto-oligosyltrehalose trehalohydrolase [Burkholderiaceae bacterium]|nr:malto-oligosyltrehalose trehalohydrolase [Burkholderiaceae bacterium]